MSGSGGHTRFVSKRGMPVQSRLLREDRCYDEWNCLRSRGLLIPEEGRTSVLSSVFRPSVDPAVCKIFC